MVVQLLCDARARSKREGYVYSRQHLILKGVKTVSLFEKMKFLAVCMFLGAFPMYFNPACGGRLEVCLLDYRKLFI